jgi:hypothetical protein
MTTKRELVRLRSALESVEELHDECAMQLNAVVSGVEGLRAELVRAVDEVRAARSALEAASLRE